MFMPTLRSKTPHDFNLKNKLTKTSAILISIFLHMNKVAPPPTSLDMAQNLSSDRVRTPLL
jgi:hypothetical protein